MTVAKDCLRYVWGLVGISTGSCGLPVTSRGSWVSPWELPRVPVESRRSLGQLETYGNPWQLYTSLSDWHGFQPVANGSRSECAGLSYQLTRTGYLNGLPWALWLLLTGSLGFRGNPYKIPLVPLGSHGFP